MSGVSFDYVLVKQSVCGLNDLCLVFSIPEKGIDATIIVVDFLLSNAKALLSIQLPLAATKQILRGKK